MQKIEKSKENKSRAIGNAISQIPSSGASAFQFVDNRAAAVKLGKLQKIVNTQYQRKENSLVENKSRTQLKRKASINESSPATFKPLMSKPAIELDNVFRTNHMRGKRNARDESRRRQSESTRDEGRFSWITETSESLTKKIQNSDTRYMKVHHGSLQLKIVITAKVTTDHTRKKTPRRYGSGRIKVDRQEKPDGVNQTFAVCGGWDLRKNKFIGHHYEANTRDPGNFVNVKAHLVNYPARRDELKNSLVAQLNKKTYK